MVDQLSRARTGMVGTRTTLEHLVGQSMILYFDNGEENYPIFQHPSTGDTGAYRRKST
jgi:trehalose utilization protein